MKSLFLVILLLFINGGCYHLLIAEDLRKEFVKLHSEIAAKVKNNETLQKDGSFILKDYKPILDRLKKLEKDTLNYDFIEYNTKYSIFLKNCGAIRKLFNVFVTLVDTYYNYTNCNSNIKPETKAIIRAIKKKNYRKVLKDFREITKNSQYFYGFLEINDQNMTEYYSKQELSFLLYQYLTIIDTKGLILISFYIFVTNSSQPLPSIAKYNDILLSLYTVSDDIWKRDPNEHLKKKTYIEIEKFLQGVIAYERHLKPFNCKNECSEFQNATTTALKCDATSPRNCHTLFYTYSNAELYNCQEVSTTLTTCPGEGSRIYQYLKFNNQMYGDKHQQCTKREQIFTKYKDCSYCVCTALYKRHSKHHISLRAVYSNIKQNRIIIGARFQEHNDLIHIQVKEGTLSPFLTVNETRWVPIENFRTSDRMMFPNQDYVRVSMNIRSVHLGDFRLSSNNKNYVLTGVRFREWEGFLSLQIHVTRFNLKSGALYKKRGSSWHDIKQTPIFQIETKDSDIPKSGSSSKIVNANSNQYIKFTHSSFKTDFAQPVLYTDWAFITKEKLKVITEGLEDFLALNY